ncbi:lytic transglycosylase domain-containing protein [Turicimonas muris]|uniref:lytic transglycosylase domain-containing protein n=1 Tax=Turicimonas muris TaxID=1796652 RepID=UPI0024943D2D|nr:lytic transglycosylase domain-containing protein [Turicimonas muris]
MLKKILAGGFVLVAAASAAADDFELLSKRCAPTVAVDTLRALVKTESDFNPYAVGVVGGSVVQPKAFHEAMSTIAKLELSGANYSVGLAQINKKNFSKYGLDAAQALDACTNLKTASKILGACYAKAQRKGARGQQALHDALSCYYSGNFKTGLCQQSKKFCRTSSASALYYCT